MKTYAAIFLSVFLAELGDKTQLATMLFAAQPGTTRAGVFAASAAALLLSTAIAVLAGSILSGWITPRHLRTAAGVVFIALGVWMLLGT